jgi:hypothetical protein
MEPYHRAHFGKHVAAVRTFLKALASIGALCPPCGAQGTQYKFTARAASDDATSAVYYGTTKEYTMCSSRGICDATSGRCVCFDSYGVLASLCSRVCVLLWVSAELVLLRLCRELQLRHASDPVTAQRQRAGVNDSSGVSNVSGQHGGAGCDTGGILCIQLHCRGCCWR